MWVCGGEEWKWLPWPSPSLLLRQVAEGSKWVECWMGSKLRRGGLIVDLVHFWVSLQVWGRFLKPRKSH